MENYEHTQIDEMINEEEPEVKEEKNPLQNLLDFYKEGVAEGDALGLGDIYKRETERFCAKMDAYFKEYLNSGFTAYDIRYDDGYFIFGFGTNSVVEFHVKEAPGWLFGIWWSPSETFESQRQEKNPKEYEKDRIKCEFFAQYEETIDKFKPSASMFSADFDWKFDEEDLWKLCFHAIHAVKLIFTYPYVAFVREVDWNDLNSDYITPEEAQQRYTEYYLKKNQEKLMQQENAKKMLECLKYIYGPVIETGDAFIEDQGPCVSPRYELIMRNIWKDNGQEESQDGCFSIFDWGAEGWEDLEEDKAYWERTINECKARAKEIGGYWFNPVSCFLYIVSSPRYQELKEKYSKIRLPHEEENND